MPTVDRVAYYFQSNLFCIVILILLGRQQRLKTEQSSTARLYLGGMIWTTILLCLSDMVAGYLSGTSYPMSRTFLQLSNILYFISLTAIGYLWFIYAGFRLDIKPFKVRSAWVMALPLILIICLACTNSFTSLFFYLDESNLYHRNTKGIIIHWVISWAYLLAPPTVALYQALKVKSASRRLELRPIIMFVIAPAFSAALQMLFYGISCTQVGITISLLVITLDVQNSQVLSDALTSLDNRRGFLSKISKAISGPGSLEIGIMMMDLDNFKAINDSFGHIVGDKALVELAQALDRATRPLADKLSICRMGGDEFAIALAGCNDTDLQDLKSAIIALLASRNESSRSFPPSVSIGYASARCSCLADVESLFSKADMLMYKEKKKNHLESLER